MANSVDPQIAGYDPSHLDICCLQRYLVAKD